MADSSAAGIRRKVSVPRAIPSRNKAVGSNLTFCGRNTMSAPAVEAIDLVKRFGDNAAVDGVSFVVPEGTVLGLLGPNGAGKTTTVRMLTTLSVPTSGTGRVAGHDILKEPDAVRRSMGLTGQAATVDELLTARENLKLIGRLYGLPKKYVAQDLRRAARAVLADRGRQPHGQDLLGRHAPAPRPGGQPDRRTAGAVPRRADDGPRPAQPHRAVGGPARAGPRRHDVAARRRNTSRRPTTSPTTSS